MIKYVLLLGSNLGDPYKNLDGATELIKSLAGNIVWESDAIETEPIGDGVHNKFLNKALMIESELEPEPLLDILENIERKLGRNKPLRTNWNIENRIFEDRLIDVDIALMDLSGGKSFKDEWHSERLCIPHRALSSRPFVSLLLNF